MHRTTNKRGFVSLVFLTTFLLIALLPFIGITDRQKNFPDKHKKVLTEETFKEDYKDFRGNTISVSIFAIVSLGFTGTFFLAIMFILIIIKKRRKKSGRISFWIGFFAAFAGLCMLGIVITILVTASYMNNNCPDDYYNKVVLVDKEKTETTFKYEKHGRFKSTKPDTYGSNTEYYLITDDGDELKVTKDIYDEYEGEGTYYLGQTKNGVVFSIYSAVEYKLEK